MVDPNILVRKNVELEGLLKVLVDRNSIEARSLLADKFREYSALMAQYLAEGADSAADDTIAGADAALAQGHYIEVKDQEAVEAEKDDDDEVPASLVAIDAEVFGQEPQPGEPEEAPQDQKPAPAPEPAEDFSAEVSYAGPSRTDHNERVLRAFTLNDRFRFCRELFGGNSEDFTDTINVIAQLPTFADAEDYLCNDMMWNADDPNVKDFMAILKECMA